MQVAFSLTKKYILASAYESGKIVIWDVSIEGSPQAKHQLIGRQKPCTSIAFSPVNNLLLCSAGMDQKIQFFDI